MKPDVTTRTAASRMEKGWWFMERTIAPVRPMPMRGIASLAFPMSAGMTVHLRMDSLCNEYRRSSLKGRSFKALSDLLCVFFVEFQHVFRVSAVRPRAVVGSGCFRYVAVVLFVERAEVRAP